MPISTSPRSVSDATRFTATTPHASSKSSPGAPTPDQGSRFAAPNSSPGGGSGDGRPKGQALGETPEQRVKRLRAAHMRAKAAQTSRFDRVIDIARVVFDKAHKATVIGLVGLTAVAGLVTVYTAVDMLAFNRKRRDEFLKAQKVLEADSLAVARLAYMTNNATEEQMQLVEEANARDADAGRSTIFKIPDVLGAPRPLNRDPNAPEAAVVAGSAQTNEKQADEQSKSGGGITGWLFSSLKKDQHEDTQSSKSTSVLGDSQGSLRAQAHSAFDKERENQKIGGPLDRVGLESDKPSEQKPSRKGWLW